MSHQEKQEIFDRYARNYRGVPNFKRLIEYSSVDDKTRLEHIFAACDLVQEEQQKRIAENMNWDRCKNKGSECRTDKHELSILNPENLIK